MKKNVTKRGFNLIEIAIVLAVIGLVIGGIYVAASSVTDNQRKQKAQSQLLTIVQNLRSAYANQAITAANGITRAGLDAARVVPGDMAPTGTGMVYSGAFGDVTLSSAANSFIITLANVSQSGCVDFISKNFASAGARAQIGLTGLTAPGAALNLSNDQTLTTAAAACTGSTNNMTFTFNANN